MSHAPEHLRVYPYRWAVLFVFALLNIVLQMHWVAFAPITREAAAFYHVEEGSIAFLSMLYLLIYLPVGLPASYIIDTLGLRVGIGAGAVLMGGAAVLKAVAPENYTAIVVAQVGLSIAQPFILNAYTRLSSQWFPTREHATATGLAALAQYVGIMLAMVLTPPLVNALGMGGMLQVYGGLTVVSAIAFLVVFREHPPTPPSHFDEEPRLGVWEGVRHILRQREMLILLYVFLVGIGVFNAVTTWIESILAPRGFTAEQAGMAGGILMLGGILGALVVPILSDKTGRRIPFLIGCTAMAVPGLAGLAFTQSFAGLMLSSFVLGVATLSSGPIGFEYGAEVSHPAPESTTQGLLMMGGQLSGALLIFAMGALRTSAGSMQGFMIVFIVATAFNAFLATRLREAAATVEE